MFIIGKTIIVFNMRRGPFRWLIKQQHAPYSKSSVADGRHAREINSLLSFKHTTKIKRIDRLELPHHVRLQSLFFSKDLNKTHRRLTVNST
jgi:hypothetical protein